MASTTPADTAQSVHTLPTPIHTTSIPSTSTPSTSTPSPLLKLDYTNYIPWKHRLITILEAYSLIQHIDGTASKPSPFVLDVA